MNTMKHTAEEIRAYAEALREALRMHRAGRSTMMSLESSAAAAPDMLIACADMIERAQKGVTNEVVEVARDAYRTSFDPENMAPIGQQKVEAMRAALLAVWPVSAERIKADEGAVPFGYVSRNMVPFRSSTPAWHFSLTKIEPHGCIEAMPLFTHPSAQVAQVAGEVMNEKMEGTTSMYWAGRAAYQSGLTLDANPWDGENPAEARASWSWRKGFASASPQPGEST